jgi:predicted nucleotide-binding protein (sugar kinase/HSP70/actin superfamily)
MHFRDNKSPDNHQGAIRLFRKRTDSGLKHFEKPKERPFTKKERESTTLLFGGLTWKHERLLQGYFEGLGYLCEPLPNPDITSLQTGKEYCDPGCCNPTYFTCGALINFLKDLEKNGKTKKEIIEEYVFFTAGSCGPCRFGMYETQYRQALKNAGFEGFRIMVFQQVEGMDQSTDNAGLDFNPDFFLGILLSFIFADLLNDIAFQLRPYEINAGSVDSALSECVELAYNRLKNSKRRDLPLIFSKILSKNSQIFKFFNLAFKITDQMFLKEHDIMIKELRKIFEKVEVNYLNPKPIVKIIGEFWAQTTEGEGNYNMHKFLEEEGAQVYPEPLGNWILYISHQGRLIIRDNIKVILFKRGLIRNYKPFISGLLNLFLLKFGERLFRYKYNRSCRSFNSKPLSYPSQDKLRKLAEHYFHPRIEGGEGHLEVGKTIYYTQNRLCHMFVSLKPFGCMPSLQSDGVMSLITSIYPEILFIPIETSGEGSINALSRVQMVLTEAKEKAFNEYNELLKEKDLGKNDLREIIKNKFSKYSNLDKFKGRCKTICSAGRFLETIFTK